MSKRELRRTIEDMIHKFIVQMSDEELDKTLFAIQGITNKFTPDTGVSLGAKIISRKKS